MSDASKKTAETDTPEDSAEESQATGTVENPIQPGEAQPGDQTELASSLGGPVDISPIRGRGKR